MARAILIGWPGLIGKCRSIFIEYSHWSLTGRFGVMESTLRLFETNIIHTISFFTFFNNHN